MLNSILSSVAASEMKIGEFAICMAVSLVLGILCIFLHSYKNQASKSFLITLALLPLIVQVIIAVVNGNLGTGVAVAGAFTLVRFRSAPGNAREISSIFLAMTIGLADGMGYIGIAILLFIFVALLTILLLNLPIKGLTDGQKALRVTIPENLDYTNIFDDLFEKYTSFAKLRRVKTTNMGSLYDLSYDITLKNDAEEKAFIDELRCRNGNLTIACGKAPAVSESAMF